MRSGSKTLNPSSYVSDDGLKLRQGPREGGAVCRLHVPARFHQPPELLGALLVDWDVVPALRTSRFHWGFGPFRL